MTVLQGKSVSLPNHPITRKLFFSTLGGILYVVII